MTSGSNATPVLKYKRFSVLIFITRSVYAPDLTSKSTQLLCNNTNNNKNSSGVHGVDTKALYRDSIYRVTSRSGSFFALFSLFSPRFCPFSGFQRLGCVTAAALGRVSAHCSPTCAVIGWISPKRGLPLAGALD